MFVSATRPNPAYMQTQALVPLTVATGIPTDQKIAVYARILEHDQTSGDYRPVNASKP